LDFIGNIREVAIIAVIIFAAIPIILSLGKLLWNRLYSAVTPVEEVVATVISRRIEVKDSDGKPVTAYYLTFSRAQDEIGIAFDIRVEYEISAEIYATHICGDTGMLSLRRGKFISFDRELKTR